MTHRSPRAEADLIVAELEALIANNPLDLVYVEPETVRQLNTIVQHLESLLGEQLPQLISGHEDVAPDRPTRSGSSTLIWAERFRTKAMAALAYARSVDSRRATVVEER